MIKRFEQGIISLEESGVLRENIICHITQETLDELLEECCCGVETGTHFMGIPLTIHESLGRWDFALMDKDDSNIFIRSGEWFTL